MAVQVYRYRRVSSVVQRQQTKWVVFGVVAYASGIFALAVLPFGPLDAVADLITALAVPLFALFIPLSFGVAILRARLWDIDVLINRTLVYGTLPSSLALIYGASVVGVGSLLRPIAGANSDLAVVVSTWAITATFRPLRRRIQRAIDRRFYRQKYDAV